MKRFFIILIVGLIMIACTSTNKQAFNSKKLKGRYDVDFSALLTDLKDSEENEFAIAFAAMFLSSMEMTMQFEDTKLILDASGAAMNLVKALANDKVEMPVALDYKIVNDSILYTRVEGNDFSEFGVLRKIGESYDYLQLLTTADDGSHMTYNLKKKAK